MIIETENLKKIAEDAYIAGFEQALEMVKTKKAGIKVLKECLKEGIKEANKTFKIDKE